MKKIISMLLLVSLFGTSLVNIQALEAEKSLTASKLFVDKEISVDASMTNANEDVSISIQEINSTVNSTDSGEEISKGYEVFFEIPSANNDVISPRDQQTGSKTEAGVKAYLYVNYFKSGDDINITSVTGGWTPTHTMYYVTNREVFIRSDSLGGGKLMKRYPTSNTFSYSPGWGYVQYYPNTNYSMSGAQSWADCHVSGMEGTHNITIKVAV